MKSIQISTLLFFFSLVTLAQEIAISEISDLKLTRILHEAELKESSRTKELSTRIYFMSNLSGSAGYNSGESTTNILVTVSEFDILPDQNLFEISEFYNPVLKNLIVIKDQIFNFTIEYGAFDKRKRATFEYSLNYLKKI